MYRVYWAGTYPNKKKVFAKAEFATRQIIRAVDRPNRLTSTGCPIKVVIINED